MSERIVFPGAIDGRQWHAHRRYPGVDHGCEMDCNHGAAHDCVPHAHDTDAHLINILRDLGVSFVGYPK